MLLMRSKLEAMIRVQLLTLKSLKNMGYVKPLLTHWESEESFEH